MTPTNYLRWRKRFVYPPETERSPENLVEERVLQQWWKPEADNPAGEWRDVQEEWE